MLDFADYCELLEGRRRNRALMARIALNLSGLAHEYPVDLSELRQLSTQQMAVTMSFLAWASLNPSRRRKASDLWLLERSAQPDVRCPSPTPCRDEPVPLPASAAPRLRLVSASPPQP